jgi:hypothetical protein
VRAVREIAAHGIERLRYHEHTTAITEPSPTPSRTTLNATPPGIVSKTISARRGISQNFAKPFDGLFAAFLWLCPEA